MSELTIEDHLSAWPTTHVALFRALEESVRALGDVRVAVSKSMVTFRGTRRGFVGLSPRARGVDGYFDIQRSLGTDDPRILRVDPYQRNLFVHHFRLTGPDELDDEFRSWLGEAFAVGNGAHRSA